MGFALDAWNAILDFINCLTQVQDLFCKLLLSNNCECDSNPRSDISLSGSELTVICASYRNPNRSCFCRFLS